MATNRCSDLFCNNKAVVCVDGYKYLCGFHFIFEEKEEKVEIFR